MKLDKALMDYADKFGENFPLYIVRGMSEPVLIEFIKKAIRDNKPYEAEYDAEGYY